MQSKTLKHLSPNRLKTRYIRKNVNLLHNTIHKDSSIIQSKRKFKLWNESEDDLLIELHEVHGNNWIKIAERIEGRTASQCIQRWRRKFQPLKVRKGWNLEEDRRLLKLVNEHGNNWKKLSKFFNKTGKQIRERYMNKLDPTIKKGSFSKEEDEVILQNYMSFGTKWNLISKKLSGRPQNSIKNRFYSCLKKKLQNERIGGNYMQEDIITENMEGNEIEKLMENDNSMSFFNVPNRDFKRVMIRNEEKPEIKTEERDVDKEEEEIEENENFFSDDNFLNKYIDFS